MSKYPIIMTTLDEDGNQIPFGGGAPITASPAQGTMICMTLDVEGNLVPIPSEIPGTPGTPGTVVTLEGDGGREFYLDGVPSGIIVPAGEVTPIDPALGAKAELARLAGLTAVEMPFETENTIANVRLNVIAAATELIDDTLYVVTTNNGSYSGGTWSGIITITALAVVEDTASSEEIDIVVTIAEA